MESLLAMLKKKPLHLERCTAKSTKTSPIVSSPGCKCILRTDLRVSEADSPRPVLSCWRLVASRIEADCCSMTRSHVLHRLLVS
jgi:hypothetical protein